MIYEEHSLVWSPLCWHSVIAQAREEMGRSNYKTNLESRIYPSKNHRGIPLFDLALFGLDVRLVIRVHSLFFTILVATGREGHWEMESKSNDPIKTSSTKNITG
jgi:hypothetical protein